MTAQSPRIENVGAATRGNDPSRRFSVRASI